MTVVGVGELLWDILPGGKQLGGAAANFAYHAQMLGAESWLVSSVGNDALGHEILKRLDAMRLLSDGITIDPRAATGTVNVELTPEGQPKFTIQEDVAWDYLQASRFAKRVAARADAICFGSLAQRREVSRSAIRSLVATTRPDALRVFDINLRQHFFTPEIIQSSLALANVLKINDEELPVLARLFALPGSSEKQIAELARRFDLKLVALTCGARGSLFFSGGVYSKMEGLPAKVVDTVGAGDSFTAMLTLGILSGWDLDRINRRANEVAAYVVSQPGATPQLPGYLSLAESLALHSVP